MNNLRKGIVCGAAGLASVGVGLSIGRTAEISNASIEACANSLQQAAPDTERLPETCINRTYSVFPTVEHTSMVVSGPDEEPFMFTTHEPELLSADEYSLRAYELKESEESKVLLQKLASLVFGVGVAGIAYYEWAINTPERHAAQLQNSIPPAID